MIRLQRLVAYNGPSQAERIGCVSLWGIHLNAKQKLLCVQECLKHAGARPGWGRFHSNAQCAQVSLTYGVVRFQTGDFEEFILWWVLLIRSPP